MNNVMGALRMIHHIVTTSDIVRYDVGNKSESEVIYISFT